MALHAPWNASTTQPLRVKSRGRDRSAVSIRSRHSPARSAGSSGRPARTSSTPVRTACRIATHHSPQASCASGSAWVSALIGSPRPRQRSRPPAPYSARQPQRNGGPPRSRLADVGWYSGEAAAIVGAGRAGLTRLGRNGILDGRGYTNVYCWIASILNVYFELVGVPRTVWEL